MAISFYSYGACREVTGSKHFLDIDGRVLQIDCGMFEGKREETYRKNRDIRFDPDHSEAVLLTHAHFDHCGALPIMVNRGYKGNVYSTSATRDVANIILLDSAHIQQKDFEYIQEKNLQYPERGLVAYPPFYTPAQAVETMGRFFTVSYWRPFSPMANVEACFFDAGHILGSALIHVQIGDRLAVGFSGDLGRKNLPIIRDPEMLPAVDYLVLEGTYGNRLHESIGMATDDLARLITTAFRQKGKIIIPAFTIERTQEIIYLIHELVREQKIPEIPIFIDSPMAVNATAIFKIHPECFDENTIQRYTAQNVDPFGFDAIRYVTSTRESKEINSLTGPAMIISASGMAESGRILHHLAHNVGNPNNIIAIVGFMAEHTLGRKLVEKQPEIKIFGNLYPLKAKVEVLNAFSGHADYREMIAWVHRHDLNRLKGIFLVHGEADSLEFFKTELLKSGIKRVDIVESGQIFPLN